LEDGQYRSKKLSILSSEEQILVNLGKYQRRKSREERVCWLTILFIRVQMLETGSLDIGFLRLPIGEHSALDVVTVHRERFVLVVPASHKLAKRKKVRLSDVSGQDFVMYERTYAPGFHDLIFGMLRDARIVPNVSQTAAEISTVISLVVAHMGVADCASIF
jgi:DNA-binding transcriptional LysR family regulator